jgi:hypothetical protein
MDALHYLPVLVLAFIAGWFGARIEHIEVIHRLRAVEGYCKGVFAANARARQREIALSGAPIGYSMPQSEEQILSEARRRGLTWETSSKRSEQ